MDHFRLEIFDIDSDTWGGPGNRLCYVPPGDIVGEPTETERLNSEWTLQFTLDLRSEACTYIAEGKAVHLFDTGESPETRERFVVRGYQTRRTRTGALLMDVYCEHRFRWLLAGSICRQQQRYDDIDAEQAADYILDDGDNLVGIISNFIDSDLADERVSIDLHYQTVLDAVRGLCGTTESVFYNVDADEDNWLAFDYLANYGTTYPTLIRYGKNLKGITKTVDWDEPATHVIPLGNGEPVVDTTRHRIKIDAPIDEGGADPDTIPLHADSYWLLNSDNTYLTDPLGSAMYVVLWDTQQYGSTTEYKGSYAIQSTDATNYEIKIPAGTVSGWGGTFSADYITIGRDSTKPSTQAYIGIDYVADKDAENARGPVVQRVYADDELPPSLNLAQNATVDQAGAWPSGICSPWVAILTPSCSKNLTSSKIMHGDSSMRVQTNGSGEGVYAPIYYTEGRSGKLTVDYLSVTLYVYLASGSGAVRVYVNRNCTTLPGNTPYPTGTGSDKATISAVGWNRVVINGIDPQTTGGYKRVSVNLIQDGATACDFYIDSYMVEPNARATEGFYGVSGQYTYSWVPTELMRRGMAYLLERNAGVTSYEVDFTNLGDALPGQYPADRFKVGDTIGIYDEDLGADVQARVMARTRNLARPQDTQIELGAIRRRGSDIIAQHDLDAARAASSLRKQAGRLRQQIDRSPPMQGFVVQRATISDVMTHKVVDWEEQSRYPLT